MVRRKTLAPEPIQWGERALSTSTSTSSADTPAPSTPLSAAVVDPSTPSRRATRRNKLSNTVDYFSVTRGPSVAMNIGMCVFVTAHSGAQPYIAVIERLWEDEAGNNNCKVRWVYRHQDVNELKRVTRKRNLRVALDSTAAAIANSGQSIKDDNGCAEVVISDETANVCEVYYSNADDIIDIDTLESPCNVLSAAAFATRYPLGVVSLSKAEKDRVFFCRNVYDEVKHDVGPIDWDAYYLDEGRSSKLIESATLDTVFVSEEKLKKQKIKEQEEKQRSQYVSQKRKHAETGRKSKRVKRDRDEIGDSDSDGHSLVDSDYSSAGDDQSNDDYDDDGLGDGDADDIKPRRRAPKTPRKTAAASKSATTAKKKKLRTIKFAPLSPTRRRALLSSLSTSGKSSLSVPAFQLAGRTVAVSTAGTIYERARDVLHASAVPDSLPCREEEFGEILAHVHDAVSEGSSLCMYISGVPGTGKTATVHEVVRTLQSMSEGDDGDEENAESSSSSSLPPFAFVEINGMKLTEPSQAYVQLWNAVANMNNKSTTTATTGSSRVTAQHAAQLLESYFSTPSPRRHTLVALIDELDLLVTQRQDLLYNLFEWPGRQHARLVVIAIANTMDLPERMLKGKVASRLGMTRVNFRPYNHEQLQQIVCARLADCSEVFEDEAVELCARKVSAVSGDARRALDICRRALEIAEAENNNSGSNAVSSKKQGKNEAVKVSMSMINRAIRDMFSSPAATFVKQASFNQKLFLISLIMSVRRCGVADVPLDTVTRTFQQLCTLHSIGASTSASASANTANGKGKSTATTSSSSAGAALSGSAMALIANSLGATQCVSVQHGRLDIHALVRLNLAEQDVLGPLRDDTFFAKVIGAMQ
ncbi:P-loop containing nucleoside triphosphate hydrolase protein [Ramicandelaber brevisporus]|nr:P-loop containing nucleoside triphosphate hydrolase protein [Ramicandelaber brevisporus]